MRYAHEFLEKSQQSFEGIPPQDFISFLEPKLQYPSTLDGIAERLDNQEPLKVKMGLDPTGPEIHLGHIVPMRVLDLFNRAGHTIDLIFGDFTAKIGDPTGRSTGRQAVSDEQIAQNVSMYNRQIEGYFDATSPNVSVRRNSEWLGVLALSDFFSYLQGLNLSEATQRKDFRERINNGRPVTLAEVTYGLMQGIDSVHLETDVEVGGIDQLLNVQQARTVQSQRGQRPEEILLTPIIEGTGKDGRKMSKSYGNYVAAKSEPKDMFGKIMSVPDWHILPYIVAFAPVRKEELFKLQQDVENNPFEAKKQLATFVVALSVGSIDEGLKQRDSFERQFSQRQVRDEDIEKIKWIDGVTLRQVLLSTGAYRSNREIGRLAQGGAIKVDGHKVSPENLDTFIKEGVKISVGKRHNYRPVGELNDDN